MAEDHCVHQIEFRWQPGKDFSATASSLNNKEMLRGWSARLAKLARPASPDANAGVPEASFVYQTFSDGRAALIWRLYEREAMALFAQSARQPLVARAIIGSSSMLTPDLALALCYTDFAHYLLPPPGQVPIDSPLEAMDSSRLSDECGQPAIDRLDGLFKSTSGIEAIIATALLNPGKPLSIVLPAPEMTLPPAGSTALLMLWGLWRTAGPLLVTDEISRRSPGWSFSSYEPPLGSSEASSLPAVVFRSQAEERGDFQPLSYRAEITVRPRSASTDLGPAGLAARTLLQAVQEVGAARLRGYLDDISEQYSQSSGRLIAISMLDPQAGQLGTEATAVADASQSDAFFERESAGITDPASAADADPGDLADGDGSEAADDASTAEQQSPLTLFEALDRLHAGPADPGFDQAKAFVQHADVPADFAERDQVRRHMQARHWYVESLVLDDRWHAAETLEAIVRIVVIPDLTDAKVCRLLENWAGDAPVELIRALTAAAYHSGKRTVMRLETALQYGIYKRWLKERGVHLYDPPATGKHRQASR